MDEDQFLLAIDDVAEAYFDEDYDAHNGTEVAAMKLDAKREMLY